jgi:hypothetical protein
MDFVVIPAAFGLRNNCGMKTTQHLLGAEQGIQFAALDIELKA